MSLRKSSSSRKGSNSDGSPKPKARRRCTPAPSSVGLERTSRLTGRMDIEASYEIISLAASRLHQRGGGGTHVQEHQAALQFRPAGHRRGDPRRLPAVRAEDQRLHPPLQGERSRLRDRRGADLRGGPHSARLPGDPDAPPRPGDGGREGAGEVGAAVRAGRAVKAPALPSRALHLPATLPDGSPRAALVARGGGAWRQSPAATSSWSASVR